MIFEIEIGRLRPNPKNPRSKLGDVTELSASIAAQGVLQNIAVVMDDEAAYEEFKTLPDSVKREYLARSYTGDFMVIIGHRRLEAAKLAGRRTLPCSIINMDALDLAAVMMQENLQREDLTLPDEAYGYQMMMDEGGTVETIADKLGVSESKVRRRLKLTEFDRELLERADERGATLEDFAKIHQLKDEGQKEKALKAAGTSNFHWVITQALAEEKRRENEARITAELEGFATEIDGWDYSTHVRVNFFPTDGDGSKPIERPADADDIEYFYRVDNSCIYLLKENVRPASDETPENVEARERREDSERRFAMLRVLGAQAYELREKFVLGLAPSKVKRHYPKLVCALAYNCATECSIDFDDKLADWLGIELDEEAEDYAAATKVYKEALEAAIEAQPERALLLTTYASFEDCAVNSFAHRWQPHHEDNDSLDRLYALLEVLGYGMSDDERALRDGAHELFVKPGATE